MLKSMNKTPFIWFSVLLLFLSTAHVTGSQRGASAAPPANELLQIARSQGSVNIIVKIDVPGIEELTAYSNRFKTGEADMAAVQAAVDADLELEQAISTVSQNVLYQLNGTTYDIHHTFSTLPFLALEVSPAALQRLENMSEVIHISEDKPLPLPDYSRMESTDSTVDAPQLNQSTKIVGADTAWGLGFTGNGWYVAILDTGIRKSHEAFTGKSIREACFSLRRDCPNGQYKMTGPGAAAHYESEYYGFGHGSHVSCIAAGNNQDSVFGIAKDAGIIAIQVFSRFSEAECQNYGFGSPCVLSYNSDQLKGLEYLYTIRNQYNIAAANLSLGGEQGYATAAACDAENGSVKTAVDNLRAVGIATAIAAGNSGFCTQIAAPACISSAIAVGATDKSDREASFSNWQIDMLDLLAPGVSIRAATGDSDISYASWGGTSMATPHVAGAWALVKQFSNLDVSAVLAALTDIQTLITTKCGTGQQKPRLDVGYSLQSLLTVAPPSNFSGEQQQNRSFLQTEYINILTWEPNELNINKTVVAYRLYLVDENDTSKLNSLAEVDGSIFTYSHRKVEKKKEMTYAITAVTDEGDESLPARFTLEFGHPQETTVFE
jgi:subtilisin family serine protease